MSSFHYINDALFVDAVSVSEIIDAFATPCYIYSRTQLEKNWHAFSDNLTGLSHKLCYAVKANSNLTILKYLADKGSGFDIVSSGELSRVLTAGANPQNIVFSGVGKTTAEIQQALEVGISCFNVESEAELIRLNQLATQHNTVANIALRINPNIDAKTHPYIATGLHENKFGMELDCVLAICKQLNHFKHVKLMGIACHIGSQLTELSPFMEALDCLLAFEQKLANLNIHLKHLNIGGGLGITYSTETPPSISEYVTAIKNKIKNSSLQIILEPGRAILGNAGILVTRVEYLKKTVYKNFAVVDAGMNDLIRPALYHSWQNIIPVTRTSQNPEAIYDIVGPVCESADFFAKDRSLLLAQNDLLAICDVGAYGFSMSSNYNSRPRAAEVMVDGKKFHVIRKREQIIDLLTNELNT